MLNTKNIIDIDTLFDVDRIVEMIQNNKWPNIQKHDVRDFLKQIQPNHYIPNPLKLLQVRNYIHNEEFVEKIINKVKNTEDYSLLENGVLVYFPEDAVILGSDFKEKKIKGDSYMVIGGTHGSVIKSRLGINKSDYFIVNFKKHLNSDPMKVVRLGNLLNKKDVSFNELDDDNIRDEFYLLIQKKRKEEKNALPTEEEIEDFLNAYPQINRRTIGQWISHHKDVGGRKAPKINWTKPQLIKERQSYELLEEYVNHEILQPMHLESWKEDVTDRCVCAKVRNNKDKVLAILYASSDKQVRLLDGGKFQTKVRNYYENVREKMEGFTEVEFIFLKHR